MIHDTFLTEAVASDSDASRRPRENSMSPSVCYIVSEQLVKVPIFIPLSTEKEPMSNRRCRACYPQTGTGLIWFIH